MKNLNLTAQEIESLSTFPMWSLWIIGAVMFISLAVVLGAYLYYYVSEFFRKRKKEETK